MYRPAALLAATLAVLALAIPTAASAGTVFSKGDAILVLAGDVTVLPKETVKGVFIASGDARIAGQIDGDVVVLNGDVLVSGTVTGDVITANGRARLLPSARVGGNVNYGDEHPDVSPRASVSGDVTDADWSNSIDLLPFVSGFVIWLAVGVSFLLLGSALLLMAPRTADALYQRSKERLGPLIAIGIAILISLPVACFIAAVTVVGIPLAIGILLAMAPLFAVAYVATAFVLGRTIVKAPRHRILSFLAGLAILRVLALVPVLGLFAGLAAIIFGLGLIGAAIGAARQPADAAQSPGS